MAESKTYTNIDRSMQTKLAIHSPILTKSIKLYKGELKLAKLAIENYINVLSKKIPLLCVAFALVITIYQ